MSDQETDIIINRHGNVWFAPQPTEADLDKWAEDGVVTVVNSRTPGETAGLDYHLPTAVEARGMQYVELPLGGTYHPHPGMTGILGRVLEEAEGPVVLHCRSGTRSAHLYAAHLASTDPAIGDPFEAMGWPGDRDLALVQALVLTKA